MTESVLHLSSLVGSPLLDLSGERLGKVEDLIARLDTGDPLPPITGLKARIGGREMFVPANRIAGTWSRPRPGRQRPSSTWRSSNVDPAKCCCVAMSWVEA